MANFSQLRRRQSSREILYRTQFSVETAMGGDEVRRGRRHSAKARLHRQMSDAPDPDEIGELLWEMRPRYATSAGELKKHHRQLREKERQESGKRLPAGIPEEKASDLLEPTPSRVSSVSQFSQPPEGAEAGKESWDSKLTFILATIGYAVGLGNVWRFPYLAQKNGGGAFLIPYWIMLFAEGLPIFLLELAVGQRLRKGSIGVWKQISPYAGGIGIASGVVSFNVALYYNVIIALCLAYFVNSFQFPLPWSLCPDQQSVNATSETLDALTECQASSPTQYYWYRATLDISSDIETLGSLNWKLALCLVAAWALVYLCIIKGITENPKVIYVTAIYPYAVLIIFFVRAITLDGMADGITHLFTPKWERLYDPVVWLEAGTQIFFSLGLAFGGLIAYSSYNPVNNNCTRDALIVAFTNCCTSMFAAIVIFAIMGFKANVVHQQCLASRNETLVRVFGTADIDLPDNGIISQRDEVTGQMINMTIPECNLQEELEQSASGTGLAFILFTEAVNQFPLGNLWALLFFLMIFTLGLDSQFGTMQGVIQCIVDLNIAPNMRKELLTGSVCLFCLVLSLIFCNGAGNYLFTLFDNFAGSVPLLVIALFECLAVAYVYGLKNFSNDIELMTGSRPSLYWLLCWKYISPLAMTSILLASITDIVLSGSGYEQWDALRGLKKQASWPTWAQLLIVVLILMSILWIPVVALLRRFNVQLLRSDAPAWFPAQGLRAYYGLKEHKLGWVERRVLGMREDEREGVCLATKYTTIILPPENVVKNEEVEEQEQAI